MSQRPPKTSPRAPKTSPGCSHDTPKATQDHPSSKMKPPDLHFAPHPPNGRSFCRSFKVPTKLRRYRGAAFCNNFFKILMTWPSVRTSLTQHSKKNCGSSGLWGNYPDNFFIFSVFTFLHFWKMFQTKGSGAMGQGSTFLTRNTLKL